jgi:hypothetical protein
MSTEALVFESGACPLFNFQLLFTANQRHSDMAISGQEIKNDVRNMQRRVLWCAMTLLYVILEVEREFESKDSPQYRATIRKLCLTHKKLS